MIDVSLDDCGVWLPGYKVIDTPEYIRFSINVINLSIEYGMSVKNWESDSSVALAGVADDELLGKLDDTLMEAVSYLNSIIPETFWFDADNYGLTLMSLDSEGKVVGI